MIDTHCHLDRVADLAAALDNDLLALVTVGTGATRSEAALELAQREARVFASVGVHPTDAADARAPEERRTIERLAEEPRVVAIGETGVDLYWETEGLDVQLEALRWQIELAERVAKPVILHVRDRDGREDASLAAARAIEAGGYGHGILHCANAHPELLGVAIAAGWHVSFAGNLTYPKATRLHEAAREVPLERLLVETDAPFLAPAPHRGRPNLPGYVTHTAAYLAQLRGIDLARLERHLDANAIGVYGLPLSPA
jgi:TatD DNase family protein